VYFRDIISLKSLFLAIEMSSRKHITNRKNITLNVVKSAKRPHIKATVEQPVCELHHDIANDQDLVDGETGDAVFDRPSNSPAFRG